MVTFIDGLRDDELLTAVELGVATGAMVTAADSKRIGTVDDVRGPFFKVRRGWFSSDCWLDIRDVVAVFADEVLLDFDKQSLRYHRVREELVALERAGEPGDDLLEGLDQEDRPAAGSRAG
jgi:hypothetical protein